MRVSDGWNSLWYFILGALTYKIPIILLMFLIYETYYIQYNKNIVITLLEYFIGLLTMISVSYTFNNVYEGPFQVTSELLPELITEIL